MKKQTTDLSVEELRAFYEKQKANQRKWGKRYRVRQQLLRAKLDAMNIEVTDDEVDEALGN